MKSLTKTYQIKASCQEVWEALTDPKIIDLWGGGKAQMDDSIGTKFSLWNGDIFGKNLDVIPGEKLVQEWSSKGWGTPSAVTFTLNPKDDHTEVVLSHEGIPDEEFEKINEGWDKYYLGAIKKLLEKS